MQLFVLLDTFLLHLPQTKDHVNSGPFWPETTLKFVENALWYIS